MAKWKLDLTARYLTDNGRTLCAKHLGATAQATGRDISGQSILRITPDMDEMFRQTQPVGHDLAVMPCEECRYATR